MSLSITDLFTPASVSDWQTKLLTVAGQLGLTTTSWQAGGITRTEFAILANMLNTSDTLVSTMNQGGFLDSASAVTTDPSTNPGVAAGWLDIVADGMFNVQRIGATYASNTLTITNSSAQSYGPFGPGTYHVANPATKATYSNTSTLTIAPSGTTNATFAADISGASGTSGPGTITQAVTSFVGVTVSNAASFVGANAESNASVVTRCRAKLATISPNGAGGAYQYFALSAYQLLQAQTPSVTLSGGPITRVLVETSNTTGQVTITIANATGVVGGFVNLAVTGATNATPIVITTASPHGLSTGNAVTVSGVLGNAAANGTFIITSTGASTFSLNGSAGTGAYTTGGVVEGGDVGEVDRILQSNCVPDAVTAVTQSASQHNVAVIVDVWVPVAYASLISSVITTALTNYFSTFPIGGITDPGGSYTNVLPVDIVEEVVGASASYIVDFHVTLNGAFANVQLLTHEIATMVPSPVINVHGV